MVTERIGKNEERGSQIKLKVDASWATVSWAQICDCLMSSTVAGDAEGVY